MNTKTPNAPVYQTHTDLAMAAAHQLTDDDNRWRGYANAESTLAQAFANYERDTETSTLQPLRNSVVEASLQLPNVAALILQHEKTITDMKKALLALKADKDILDFLEHRPVQMESFTRAKISLLMASGQSLSQEPI